MAYKLEFSSVLLKSEFSWKEKETNCSFFILSVFPVIKIAAPDMKVQWRHFNSREQQWFYIVVRTRSDNTTAKLHINWKVWLRKIENRCWTAVSKDAFFNYSELCIIENDYSIWIQLIIELQKCCGNSQTVTIWIYQNLKDTWLLKANIAKSLKKNNYQLSLLIWLFVIFVIVISPVFMR